MNKIHTPHCGLQDSAQTGPCLLSAGRYEGVLPTGPSNVLFMLLGELCSNSCLTVFFSTFKSQL